VSHEPEATVESASEMIAAMSVNRIAPATNASTATSSAPAATAGPVPPCRAARSMISRHGYRRASTASKDSDVRESGRHCPNERVAASG